MDASLGSSTVLQPHTDHQITAHWEGHCQPRAAYLKAHSQASCRCWWKHRKSCIHLAQKKYNMMPATQTHTGQYLRITKFAATCQPPDADVLAPLQVCMLGVDQGVPVWVSLGKPLQPCISVAIKACSCHSGTYCESTWKIFRKLDKLSTVPYDQHIH